MRDFPGFLLNWVGQRSREAFAAQLGELGLKPPQFAALNVIDARPGLTQQALVGQTGIDPSTMVATLDSLEALGLAERRPHPTDRRKRAVHLTKAGQRKLAEGHRLAADAARSIFGALTQEEYAELSRLLQKLAGYDVE